MEAVEPKCVALNRLSVLCRCRQLTDAADVHWSEQNLLLWGHWNVHENMRPLVFGNHDDADDYENDDHDGSTRARCCQSQSPTKLILAVKPVGCWDKSSWDMKCGYQTKIIIILWRNEICVCCDWPNIRGLPLCWELLLQAVTDTSDPATELKPTFVSPKEPRRICGESHGKSSETLAQYLARRQPKDIHQKPNNPDDRLDMKCTCSMFVCPLITWHSFVFLVVWFL